jgi:hypothetical protein
VQRSRSMRLVWPCGISVTFLDALIVKTYATFAPTKPLSLRIGDGSTVAEESRTR